MNDVKKKKATRFPLLSHQRFRFVQLKTIIMCSNHVSYYPAMQEITRQAKSALAKHTLGATHTHTHSSFCPTWLHAE